MAARGNARYRIGVDIGGTFTDFLLLRESGELVLDKVLTTAGDPSEGVLAGLGRLAERESCSLGDLLSRTDAIVHGTTIADNALIEMQGAVTGLVATAGFRDELDMRRGYKEDIWDVRLPAPPPLVPPMSMHSRSGASFTAASAAPPITPPAGPDASTVTGRWRMYSRVITPPLHCMTSSSLA